MNDASYYTVLGVERDATVEAIKKAFRVAAKKYHPDMTGSNGQPSPEYYAVEEAFHVLVDPKSRLKYDAILDGLPVDENDEEESLWDTSAEPSLPFPLDMPLLQKYLRWQYFLIIIGAVGMAILVLGLAPKVMTYMLTIRSDPAQISATPLDGARYGVYAAAIAAISGFAWRLQLVPFAVMKQHRRIILRLLFGTFLILSLIFGTVGLLLGHSLF